jgi:sulfate permease, SulP family
MEGILLGVLASLLFLLKAVTFPHDAVLGRTSDGFRDLAHHQDAQAVPGVIVYRFSGPLIFANCSQFRSRIETLVQETAERPQLFVLDASAIFEVDLAACETLIDVAESLRGQGIRFALVDLRARVKATLGHGGLAAHVGEDACFSTVEAAMDRLRTST